MSKLGADTGGEAPLPVTSTAGLSASSPTSGFIFAEGRLTPQEIALQAAGLTGATGISSAGFWTSEEVS